ncbi:ATP-binding protein [Stakelama sp. CBK3Z-3]|uniref:histidine kinase n=1 Tax=Stakelama flava TaxID=2860338 RepID=A0ABS6XJY1_9SPHN|nr:ATP-binding protein [Stakelama flava]MBW4330118.1 ATP-binding protein [Stakelama flava]
MTLEIVTIRIGVESDIPRVRQVADLIARSLGRDRFAHTRLVTAVLEIARNALQYAGGGQAKFSVAQERGKAILTVRIIDQGAGIDDRDAARDSRRDRGMASGGLGLGLSGVKRLADRFDITSSQEGTRVDLGFFVPVDPDTLADHVAKIDRELVALSAVDPVAELARQNRELAEAMAERELLIDEIHHRTGNNLALIASFIQMSSRTAQLPETKQAMAELEARVHAVARVHQELQRSHRADRVDLIPLLENVARHAKDAFSTDARNIAIDVDGAPAMVASNTAIDLGLITGELITNSFKHAFRDRREGKITIRFAQIDERDRTSGWRLTVGDDGAGFTGAERPERPESLGWRMIRAMSARHGGTIATDGSAGFVTTLTFPPELVVAGD